MVGLKIWHAPHATKSFTYEQLLDPTGQVTVLHCCAGHTLLNSVAVRLLCWQTPVAQVSEVHLSVSVQGTGVGSQFPVAGLHEYVVQDVLAEHGLGVYTQLDSWALQAAVSHRFLALHTSAGACWHVLAASLHVYVLHASLAKQGLGTRATRPTK
jgi:hypothetical protein